MDRHTFLRGVHDVYQPRSYLEIGINDGRGLHLSRTRTIGVDPAFKITSEFECDLKMVKATSDEFFAREDAIARFPEGVIDLTFIDGLHIFEYALRDFMNAERLSSPNSVIVFDDMLPRAVPEAARDRYTMQWAGDVYKVAQVLERFRSDLVLIPINSAPTGMMLVLGIDPTSQVLTEHYEQIVAEYAVADPQDIPDAILHRRDAADPGRVLALPMWADLVAARDAVADRPASIRSALEVLGTATYVSAPPNYQPYPPKRGKPTPPPPALTLPQHIRPVVRPRTRIKKLLRRVGR